MHTISGESRHEEVIRRSRFVGIATAVRTQAESLAFYERVADASATHNCWAWRINLQCRCNDDGEPSGTAGRPILNSIEGRELDQVMVIVTRYYGGTKLGVGGLLRAYGGVAAKCLDGARRALIVQWASCRVHFDYALSATVHQLLDQFDCQKQDESFSGSGMSMSLRLPSDRLEGFGHALADISRGEARLERL